MRPNRVARSRVEHFQVFVVFVSIVLVAGDAHAQLDQFDNLATTIVKILQGIGIAISAIGFIVAGVKFNSGDPSAKDQAKNAVIGSALIAGAVILAQFVKGFFN